jgi:hypothetical protein
MEYKERRPKIESYEYEGFGRQIVANACISQQFLITKNYAWIMHNCSIVPWKCKVWTIRIQYGIQIGWASNNGQEKKRGDETNQKKGW